MPEKRLAECEQQQRRKVGRQRRRKRKRWFMLRADVGFQARSKHVEDVEGGV